MRIHHWYFVLIKSFPHIKVAIEKAVNSHVTQHCEVRRYALNCFYNVLSGATPWEEYKTMWGAEEKWIKYLYDNWVCEKWWSLINASMRKLMNTLWKDCDNESEVLFAVLKGENDRTSDMRALFERLIGPPDISGVTLASITGLKLADLNDILEKKDTLSRFKRRDQTYAVVQTLIERWVEWLQKDDGSGAVKESFFTVESNDPLRTCTVGLQTGGMCLSMAVPAAGASGHLASMPPTATDAARTDGARLASMNKSAKNMSKNEHGILESHIPISNAKNIDCGTGKNAADAIQRAVQVAKDAAVFKLQILDVSLSESILNLATYTADLAAVAPEFNALCSARRDVLINRIQSGLQYATKAMVESLLMMCLAPKGVTSSSGISDACSNQELRKSLLTAHPALSRIHFKELSSDGQPHQVVPHFGYIYIICITMSAQDWYTECLRVMRGDVQSLQFRRPLSIGYLIALQSVYSMCSSLVSSELGSNEVTAFYVGQELRNAQSSTRLGRIEDHGTSAGSSNIQELWFVSSKKTSKGFMCMPLGSVSVEKRILAFLPPNAVIVNTMEAALLIILLAIPGMVSLNDSPPGQNERFLQPSFNSPAQMHQVCSMYLTSVGGISVSDSKAVSEVTMPWLKRALKGVEWLLSAGLFKNDSGTLIAPALFHHQGIQPAFSVSQCIDALLGGVSTRKSKVALWCMGCDCIRTELWCEHLLLSALRENSEGIINPPTSSSPTLLFFIPKPIETMAIQLAKVSVSRINVPLITEAKVSLRELFVNSGVDATCILNCLTVLGRGDLGESAPKGLRKALESISRSSQMLLNCIDVPLPSFSGPNLSTSRMTNSGDIAVRQATERGICGASLDRMGSLSRIMNTVAKAAPGSDTHQPFTSQVL